MENFFPKQKNAQDWGITSKCIQEFESSVTDEDMRKWVEKTQRVYFLKRKGYYSDFGRSGESSWVETGLPVETLGQLVVPDPQNKKDFLIGRLYNEESRAIKLGLTPAKWGSPTHLYR